MDSRSMEVLLVSREAATGVVGKVKAALLNESGACATLMPPGR